MVTWEGCGTGHNIFQWFIPAFTEGTEEITKTCHNTWSSSQDFNHQAPIEHKPELPLYNDI
jgi:hypothetical protein